MEIRLVVFFVFFSLVFPQQHAFPGCGDQALTQKLNDAALRAAKWLSENLIDNRTETEGHILGTAFHSLRLVSYPLGTLTNHSISNIYKDFDVNGTQLGKIAQYTQGYIATGREPRKEFIERLRQGIKKCCTAKLTHPFQYMVTLLALCNSGSKPYIRYWTIHRVMKKLLSQRYRYRSIDAVAMATIALRCVKRKQRGVVDKNRRRITDWIRKGIRWLLKRQKTDGRFGENGITTALAVQAIISRRRWAKLNWQCSKAMKYLLSQQKDDGSFGDLMSSIQILPVLKGKRPYDRLRPAKNTTSSKISSSQTNVGKNATSLEEKQDKLINVCLKIQISETDQRQFDVKAKEGSTVHEIFKMAEQQHGGQFTFRASKTKYGAMIESICGFDQNYRQRLHWMMYSSPVTLATVGVDGLRPENDKCVIFKLMKTGDESLPCGECETP